MKQTEEQKDAQQRERMIEIRNAIVRCFLRGGPNPNVEQIAAELDGRMTLHHVRTALRASSRHGSLDTSEVPGCQTQPPRGRGESTTWCPTTAYLRALMRGEGDGESAWRVTVDAVVPNMPYGGPTLTYTFPARTEEEAWREAWKRAEAHCGKLHQNTRMRAEWLGRLTPASAEEARKP